MAGKPKTGGEYQGPNWKVRGPKLKLRHVAVLQSGRWMGARANTRIPALLLVLGYPATLVMPLLSSLVVIGVGLLASVVVWHISYRSVLRPGEHASKSKLSVATDWACRVTALIPTYLLWTMVVRAHIATVSGSGLIAGARRVRLLFGTVFDGRWFLAYATAATVSWLLIFRAPHVVTRHHERRAAEASPFRGMEEFEGTNVISRKATRVGERYRLGITGSGKAVSDFLDKKIKERVAGKLGLPASRVLI